MKNFAIFILFEYLLSGSNSISTFLAVPVQQNLVLSQTATPNQDKSNSVLGKELFLANCGKCHKLYLPSDFSRQKWGSIIKKMQKKAKLTNEETQLVLNYILEDLK